MAKPKQRPQVAISAKKNSTPSGLGTEPTGDDSWVIVKKQIVRILIPPLPVNKQSTTPDLGPSQLQAKPRKTINAQSEYPMQMCLPIHSVPEREKSTPLSPLNKGMPTARISPRSIPTLSKQPRIDQRMGTENPDHVDNLRCHNAFGVHSSSRVRKRPLDFLGAGAFLNQRMRASNLDRKLQRAGGLSHWLASLGLEQFVKIFQGKSVNKFQLVNLTMKKLKDMGADAVGPRRKLMHAIDCLCQPYCFEAL
ncbi:hypothetical protein Acr_20g0010930 [Actinidia rufa]|uniref:SAM domain-containing protein n=1 Tax=Actinidia rufa TaxID=165716 RepID=A0A7J0GET9_9ERIC|nr:hypothetical protein Acr_20g0010930 [Actinidia rufa]